jgi:hypothetical protein
MVRGNSSLEAARNYCGKASFSIFLPVFKILFPRQARTAIRKCLLARGERKQ